MQTFSAASIFFIAAVDGMNGHDSVAMIGHVAGYFSSPFLLCRLSHVHSQA